MDNSPNAVTQALGANDLEARIQIANWIGPNTTVTLQNPTLLQGSWVPPPPENFSQVGWQEQQNYAAKGKLPTGVEGDVTVRIDGKPGTAKLTWVRNINTSSTSFNGKAAEPGKPLDTTWQDQKVKLSITLAGNTIHVRLDIGSDQPTA